MMTMNSDYFGKYFVPADELYDAGEYAQAIAFLEPAFEEFPEHYFKTAFHTLFCYRGLDKLEKCVELIESSVKRGYFFTLRGEILDRVQAVDGGQSILAENERLKAQAQKEAKMRYEVHLPENYTPEKRHPLLLTLHCGGGHLGNIESHRHYWKPDAALKRGFIVVYVQSSHVSCSGGYSWDEDAEQHRKELGQAYDEVLANYAVDTETVIVSGFSAGGTVSIDVVVNDVLPVKGFIALGPDKPQEFTREQVEKARQRGCRGVIMEGESSADSPDLQEIETVFKELGFPYELVINQGIGHWYPADLTAKVEKAISFILDE